MFYLFSFLVLTNELTNATTTKKTHKVTNELIYDINMGCLYEFLFLSNNLQPCAEKKEVLLYYKHTTHDLEAYATCFTNHQHYNKTEMSKNFCC